MDPDPDPYQNDTDPENCFGTTKISKQATDGNSQDNVLQGFRANQV